MRRVFIHLSFCLKILAPLLQPRCRSQCSGLCFAYLGISLDLGSLSPARPRLASRWCLSGPSLFSCPLRRSLSLWELCGWKWNCFVASRLSTARHCCHRRCWYWLRSGLCALCCSQYSGSAAGQGEGCSFLEAHPTLGHPYFPLCCGTGPRLKSACLDLWCRVEWAALLQERTRWCCSRLSMLPYLSCCSFASWHLQRYLRLLSKWSCLGSASGLHSSFEDHSPQKTTSLCWWSWGPRRH